MILVPFIVISFYIPSQIPNMIVGLLYTVASLTDFFDGKLARLYNVQSSLGKCFDPIADKLLVCVSLIMLVNFSQQKLVIVIPAVVIICREIVVAGLREFLATIKVSVPVTRLSKWKTAIQLVAIGTLLFCGKGSEVVYNDIMDFIEIEHSLKIQFEGVCQCIGEFLLCVSAMLTLITGYLYLKTSLKNFNNY